MTGGSILSISAFLERSSQRLLKALHSIQKRADDTTLEIQQLTCDHVLDVRGDTAHCRRCNDTFAVASLTGQQHSSSQAWPS